MVTLGYIASSPVKDTKPWPGMGFSKRTVEPVEDSVAGEQFARRRQVVGRGGGASPAPNSRAMIVNPSICKVRVAVERDARGHEFARRDIGRVGLRARIRTIGVVADRIGCRFGRIDRDTRKSLPEQAKPV